MAADVTQAVDVIVLGDGFGDLPVPIMGVTGIPALIIDLKSMESGGDTGGGSPTRPTSGMIYPRA